MADYDYQGTDRKGNKVQGSLTVENEAELRMILRNQGIRPLRISKKSMIQQDIGSLFSGGKIRAIPIKQLVPITNQLHVLVSSGIPLAQALELLLDQADNPNIKRIFLSIKDKVSQGGFLWEALSSQQGAFPKIYVSLIRAGEASGALDVMLKRLTRYIEDSERIQRTIKGALTYPAAVVFVSIIVIIILMTFVVPQMASMVKSTGGELPGITQFVISLSEIFEKHGLYIIGGFFTGSYLIFHYIKTEHGRKFMQKFMYRMPIFGSLIQKSGVARFSRTMSTLLSSGLTLVDSMDICKHSIDNVVIEEAVALMKKDIENGKPVSSAASKVGVFPKMAVQMIQVGETTGSLDKMLDRVADFYEQDVEVAVEGSTKLIEPVLIIVLGGIVAFLLIAMYLPMFKMGGAVSE